jgi:hypothetical protein
VFWDRRDLEALLHRGGVFVFLGGGAAARRDSYRLDDCEWQQSSAHRFTRL